MLSIGDKVYHVFNNGARICEGNVTAIYEYEGKTFYSTDIGIDFEPHAVNRLIWTNLKDAQKEADRQQKIMENYSKTGRYESIY